MNILGRNNILFVLERFHRYVFLLVLIFLPAQLGLHTWPAWSLVLGRRVDYLSPTLYLTDLLVLLTVGSFTLQYLLQRSYSLRFLFKRKYVTAAIVFLCLNTFLSIRPPVSAYFFLKIIEYALLVWYIYNTKPSRAFFRIGIGVAILWSVTLAIVQLFLQRSVGGPFWYLGERTFTMETLGIARIQPGIPFLGYTSELILRPYATFPHPNVLGGFLAIFLPLFLFGSKPKHKRFFACIIACGVLSTFSRSAYFISLLFFVLALIRQYAPKFRGLLMYGGLTLAFLATLSLFFTYAIPGSIKDMESISVRADLAYASVAIWRQSPVIGVGAGTFLAALPSFVPTKTISFLQPVHNVYLLIGAEFGFIGLCFTLLGIWKSMKMLIRTQPSWIHASIAAALVFAATDHFLFTLQQGQLITALLVGMYATTIRRKDPETL